MRLLLALVAIVAVHAVSVADEPQKMNVLFIASDDLNTDLGCYGHPVVKSPNIDKLAAKGVRFDKAYCQYPLCNPSRASFLTGLRPDTLNIYNNGTQFRENKPDIQSLPQTFRRGDYFVARVGKLYHYGVPGQIGTSGLDDPASWDKVVNPSGFDKIDEEKGRIFTLKPDAKGSSRFGGVVSWLASEGDDLEQTDGKCATETINLIKQNKEKPFFIACGFYRPHTPYVAPKDYFKHYPEETIALPTVPSDHLKSAPAPAFGSHKPEHSRLVGQLGREATQAYWASITFMDAQVGRLLDALKQQGLEKNTIVVFVSDHGYHLGDHTLWQKQSVFEKSARVPLLIYDPRAEGNGQVCERTVELVDLHATLAELCKLDAPKTDGDSLVPLLQNPQAKWNHPAYTQVQRGGGKKNPSIMGRSVRTEKYRYTEWGKNGKQGVQLYDYSSDPNEYENLADDPNYADVVKRMQKLLAK